MGDNRQYRDALSNGPIMLFETAITFSFGMITSQYIKTLSPVKTPDPKMQNMLSSKA
jgi:hypothetical protein